MGLSECEAHTQEFLSQPPETVPPDPAQSEVSEDKKRKGFEYLTIRGQEPVSVLLGVRANTSRRMEVLEWHRIAHGKHEGTICYSRTMLCRIYTDDSVGQLGRSHTCRIIHLHRHKQIGAFL